MPKQNPSARMGDISDVLKRPTQPPARELPDSSIEARVANLERAVNNLERAVSEILHQLADISEQLDRPSKDQVLGTPPKQAPKPQKKQPQPQPQPQPQEKPKPASTPDPKIERLSKEQVATLSDRIYELLRDGTPRSKAEICEAVGCDKQQYGWARQHLIKTKRMQKNNDIVAGEICNVPGVGLAIWTQEQVDAELQKRKSAKTTASDANT